MFRTRIGCAMIGLVVVFLGHSDRGLAAPPAPYPWKAGVAVAKITPKKSMWMSGYAARKKPSEGVAQDLFAKSLALEDQDGNRVVIVTLDLIGVVVSLRESVEQQVSQKHRLPPESLLLAASHTHCGPEYRHRKGTESDASAYHKFLEDTLVRIVGESLKDLAPAQLTYNHARAGFAMNRRRNYRLPKGDVNENKAPNPDGPVDHDVPVLSVADAAGKLRAVLFGYACHSTTLGFYQFCGDYGGYAQEYLEQAHPGMTALFVAGCGADQNPYPRSTLELAQQHGRSLATGVEAALYAFPRPLRGPLRAAMERIPLKKPTAAEPLAYPVQVIRFGNDVTLITLASEVVVDYSLRLKRQLAAPPAMVWVAGYSNGYFGYIPSDRVLQEGGYEAASWKTGIEEPIVAKVMELYRRLDLADDSLSVLPARESKALQDGPLYRYLNQMAEAAIQRRLQAFEQIKTVEQARSWQQERREFFVRQLGGFPQRTPLDAKVVGTLAGDRYRVEKVIYQSQPNHRVTGLVYLPVSKPPYPGVLIPCGHSYNGKTAEGYQKAAMLLAKNGCAALCFDPIGQGERYQVLNKDGTLLPNPDPNQSPWARKQLAPIAGKPQFNPVEEHNLVGIGAVLLGLNAARYRIFDGLRSIDYLVSRPDIDAQRIGCTGNSGGGTLTSYLMALDDRIQCAAPACYLTTFRRLLDTGGPQDAEQNIFGQLAFGMDQADYVLMRAPKPTLVCAATRDATFDITGTWDIFREAKRFYARFERPEHVGILEADEPHGFTMPQRVGATRWMCRWLLGKNDPVDEGVLPIRTDEELRCSPRGQVLLMPGERSVFDINQAINRDLAPKRKHFWTTKPKAEALERVRALVGVRRLAELPEPKIQPAGSARRQGFRVDKLVLEPEPGIQLPALVFVPPKPDGEAYLYLDGRGKQAGAGPGGPVETLAAQGHLVLAVDLRGMGETEQKGKTSSYHLKDQECSLAYLLGKSLVGMRTEDVLVAARFLAGYQAQGSTRRVHLVGVGAAGIPALHAAALEPNLLGNLHLKQTLASWSHVLETSVPLDQWCSAVHGALEVYDLPDLIEAIGPKRVTVEEPTDAEGKTVRGASP